jgi:hypothetical protein
LWKRIWTSPAATANDTPAGAGTTKNLFGRRWSARGLLRLGLRLRCIFLVGAMASDCATGSRAEYAMAAGDMSGNATNGGALQAAFGRRSARQAGERCEQAQGKNFGFHSLAPEMN